MVGTRALGIALLALGTCAGCVTETHVVSGLELRRAVRELRAQGHAEVVERDGDRITVTMDESTADRQVVRELVRGCPDDFTLRWRPGARPGSEPGCPLRVDRSVLFERTDWTASIVYGLTPPVVLGSVVACAVGCEGTLQDVAMVTAIVVGTAFLAAVSVIMFAFGL